MVSGEAPQAEGSVRVDAWIWAVRLTKTRSQAAAACRAGHVRVNGERAKPAQALRAGDEVRLRHAGRDRIVVVSKIVKKRVGPPVAAECFVDNSPPPPPRGRRSRSRSVTGARAARPNGTAARWNVSRRRGPHDPAAP